MSAKKNKHERREHRKLNEQMQTAPRRTPGLAQMGAALTTAILESPRAYPLEDKFRLFPGLSRDQVILGGACYYYAAAGVLLLTTRALSRGMPPGYSLVAGMLKTNATTLTGDPAQLVVGFSGDYDSARIEAGDMHAWIDLHDGGTFHLIDFTARNWSIIATVKNMTPADYPDIVHVVSPVSKELVFTNTPFAYEVNAHTTKHVNNRFNRDGSIDRSVMDVALLAAQILDWDDSKLRDLTVH